MKCPKCGAKIKARWLLLGCTYVIRCGCGTRLKIGMGLFKDHILDWQTPEEVEQVGFSF